LTLHQPKPCARGQINELRHGAIARMLREARRVDEAAAEQEVHPRLQMREVGHLDEHLATGPHHAKQLREGRPAPGSRCSSTSRHSARSNDAAPKGNEDSDPVVTCADE
jgi:hypothetical protein